MQLFFPESEDDAIGSDQKMNIVLVIAGRHNLEGIKILFDGIRKSNKAGSSHLEVSVFRLMSSLLGLKSACSVADYHVVDFWVMAIFGTELCFGILDK